MRLKKKRLNEGAYVEKSFIVRTCVLFLSGVKVYERFTHLRRISEFLVVFNDRHTCMNLAQSAGAVEYTDCTSTKG